MSYLFDLFLFFLQIKKVSRMEDELIQCCYVKEKLEIRNLVVLVKEFIQKDEDEEIRLSNFLRLNG